MQRLLLAFCWSAWLVLLGACVSQNSSLPATLSAPTALPSFTETSPHGLALIQVTGTLAPTESVYLPPTLSASPAATPILAPSATASVLPSPTPPASPSPTWQRETSYTNGEGTRTPLMMYIGKAVAFSDDVHLRIVVPTGQEFEFEITRDTPVVVQRDGPSNAGSASAATNNPLAALRQAAQDQALTQVSFARDAPARARGVVVTLADSVAAQFPTLTSQEWATRLTPTPAGFMPTPTPAFASRWVDMPWGRVNLDPSIEETNRYAQSTWCYRRVDVVEADRIGLWPINPMGMLIGRPVSTSMLNVEVIGKDADWHTEPDGTRYFGVSVVARNTPDRSDTHRFLLQVYESAPIAVNAPVDERFDQNYKYWSIFMPVNPVITDINQVRVGQIYALLGGNKPGGWDPEVREYSVIPVKQGRYLLGLYPIPVSWLCTCDYKQQQGWLK